MQGQEWEGTRGAQPAKDQNPEMGAPICNGWSVGINGAGKGQSQQHKESVEPLLWEQLAGETHRGEESTPQ